MIDSQIEYILNDIKSITENVIIKMSDEARKHETVDSKREGDKYISAVTERDIFTSHASYEPELLIKAGMTDMELIEECRYDKYRIPRNKRDLVLKYKRETIINEFVESNDYYRTLVGLPPLNTPQSEFVYLTQDEMNFYKIDEIRPIHEYPLEILIKLERVVIPNLIVQYPDREYLKHLGSKSINLVRAREAKNFEIIFSDVKLDNVFLRSFFQTYDFCREYFMSVIYNRSFTERYELYDNFIAMHIMIMATQRMIVDTIKLSIDRDFYDLNSIKKMFDCYGVPFFEDLPLDYQRTIIKNLNVLIRTKSTDKCLYDISNILMYERIKIFKYFLVKERNLDNDNNPIIAEKPKYDDDGSIISYVPDYEKMYNTYFQSTDIYEPNVILAIENKQNRYDYLDVTEDDVLWWDTDELRKELYEREFNFIDTKYLGVNIMYNLTDLLYETVYFLNLLVDNKDTTTDIESRVLNTDAMKTGTDYLYLTLDRFSPIPISIFDSVVILCALVSKKNGMKGNIICSSPSKVLSVLGFNFEADFDLIRENIKKYPKIFKDQSILKYLDLLDIRKVEDIEILYKNFRNFADFCAERVAMTQDIKEYKAYKQLYKVFTVREETGKAFTKSNGELAGTYLEYLYDKLPHIAMDIDNMHKDKTGVFIEHVIGKLNELIPDLTYVSALNGTNNNIVKALVSLINFFKSYTTDLRNLNVVYIFSDKFNNMIKMVDDPRLFIKIFPREKSLEYNDNIMDIDVEFPLRDNLTLDYLARFNNNIDLIEKFIYREMVSVATQFGLRDRMSLIYNDTLQFASQYKYSTHNMIGEESQRYSKTIEAKSNKFETTEEVSSIDKNIEKHEVALLGSHICGMNNNYRVNDKNLNMRESIRIIYEE